VTGQPRIGPAAVMLVLLMAVLSIVMWLVAPVGVIYFAAHTLSKVGNPTLEPLLFIAIVLPIIMVTIGVILRRLDQAFALLTGYDPNKRKVPLPWNMGMTERRGRGSTILDVVMVVSVVGAGLLFGGLWLVSKPF
jgi:hypothetical protein